MVDNNQPRYAAHLFAVLIVIRLLSLALQNWDSANVVPLERSATDYMQMIGQVIRGLNDHAILPEKRDVVINNLLRLIETYVIFRTRSKPGDICVSLALYTDDSYQGIEVTNRNVGNMRPLHNISPTRFMVGHYVCMAGPGPRSVDDLRNFGAEAAKGLSGREATYRSMLIIPLRSTVNGKNLGFITIDSPRPYCFYGNHANSITITCEDIRKMIVKVLGG